MKKNEKKIILARLRWLVAAMAVLCVVMMTDLDAVTKLHESMGDKLVADRCSCALEGVRPLSCAKNSSTEAHTGGGVSTEASAQALLEQEHAAFRRRVEQATNGFVTVKAGISDVVRRYGFRRCWSIAIAQAKDIISTKLGRENGTATNLDSLIHADLRDGFYRPLLTASDEVEKLLPDYMNRLMSTCARSELLMIDTQDWDRSLGEMPISLKADSRRVENIMEALMLVQLGGTVSASVDAACLASVCKTVASLLGRAAARFSAYSLAGGGVSMIDSPAPGPADLVGLVVFGAGAALTALDVYRAMKPFPDGLSRVLNEAVDRQRREVSLRVLDQGERMYKCYLRALEGK